MNQTDVDVQTKDLEGGVKLTFMTFSFVSPALEIKAPVLNDKTVGYQVRPQRKTVTPRLTRASVYEPNNVFSTLTQLGP